LRARNIKPGFFKNEDLAEIEPIGRLLFQGLWCMADREGRLEDRPKRIKIECLPYDNLTDQKIGGLLNSLHEHGFIIRYMVSGLKYIQIINFVKHQHVNIKEPESIIPAPDLNQTNTELARCENAPLLNPPYPSAQDEEGRVFFDFKTGEFSNLNGKTEVWIKSYPAVDVMAEIKKAAAWLVANPKNKKSDYPRFLNGWLSRAQDRAPKVTNNDGPFKSTYS
jgi:hypothetical protein